MVINRARTTAPASRGPFANSFVAPLYSPPGASQPPRLPSSVPELISARHAVSNCVNIGMSWEPDAVTVIVTQWVLLSVAAAVIAARLYLRLVIQGRRLLASDMFMCAAWLMGVVASSFDIVYARLGALERQVLISFSGFRGTEEEIALVLKLFWVSNFPFHTTFYLCKAALLAVYLQIFPEFMVKRRRVLWATILYTVLAYIATMTMLFCICLPVERNWALDPKKACPVRAAATSFQIAWSLHIFGDLLIFFLPWLIVPELTLKKSLRYGVYLTFLLGVINISFCVVRFAEIQKAGADLSISVALVEIWSSLDVYIGLIVACLPSLRPFFGSRSNSSYAASSRNKSSNAKWSDFSSTGGMLTAEQDIERLDRHSAPEVYHLHDFDAASEETKRASEAIPKTPIESFK